MRAFILLIQFLCLLASVPANAQHGIEALSVFEDAAGTKDISEIAALPDTAFTPEPDGLRAGYTRSVHWLRLKVRAMPGEDGPRYLEIHPPYLDDLRLYEPDPDRPGTFKERRTGDLQPFTQREIPYRGFIFRVVVRADEARVYHLRIQTTSSSILIPKIWPAERFQGEVQGEYALLGAVFGVLAIILAVNLIYWLGQREPMILYYLAYIGFSLVNAFIVQGFAAQFALPASPVAVNVWQSVSAMLAVAAAARLYEAVLLVDRRERLLWLMYRTLTYLPIVMLPVFMTGYATEALKLVFTFTTLTVPVSMARSYILMQRGAAGGRLFFVSTLTSLFPVLLSLGQMIGIFTGGFFSLHTLLVGLLLTVIALHLAIAARMREERGLLELAQELTRESELTAIREQQAREEQAHFISMLAHELKTPVAGIAAAADAIEIIEAGRNEEVQTRIERIRRAVRRIVGVADRYLQMDSVDNAQLEPQFADHDLFEVLRQGIEHYTGERERIRVQIEPGIRIKCDPDLLSTAVVNLLDNALKYSPPEQPVTLEGRIDPEGAIVIDVADRGNGVAEEMRETIFQRYVRAPEHGAIPGIGVGLALVRKIAELHQGKVAALDRPEGGAIFRMTFPGTPGRDVRICQQTSAPAS